MKSVTATEARKSWFRLLDEVAQGEVVTVMRRGKRIVLRAEELTTAASEVPDYRALLRVPGAEDADLWGWEWTGSAPELMPKTAGREGSGRA